MNNIILNFEESSEESDWEDDEEDSDIDNNNDDDNINFPGFHDIFNIFISDDEIKFLTFIEKDIIFSLLQQVPFLNNNNFSLIKELLLSDRAFCNPLVDGRNIIKLIQNTKIDMSKIKYTLYNHLVTKNEDTDFNSLDLHKINNSLQNCDFSQPESQLLMLPYEVLERILIFAAPMFDLNLKGYFRNAFICKKFYKIMTSTYFTKKILNKYSIENSFYRKFYNTKKAHPLVFRNVVYEFISNIFKNYLMNGLGPQLIKSVGGFDAYFKIPIIKNIHANCIDNLCGSNCAFRYHYLYEEVTTPISRGEDSSGRQFILFFYKTEKNEIFYEFIYNNRKPRDINITFSGIGINTFIGNLSVNYKNTASAMYRQLKNKSYLYIEKLITGNACETIYDNNLECAQENNKPVQLYYDTEEVKKYIVKTYYQYLYVQQQEEELNNRLNKDEAKDEYEYEDDIQSNIKCIIDPSDEEFDNMDLSTILEDDENSDEGIIVKSRSDLSYNPIP
jgi:hypothetical protein